MATVTFDNATRCYPGSDKPAVDKLDLDDRGRRVPGPRRSLRLRQVHLPADARRPRGGQRRQDLHRRPRRHRPPAQGPRHRDGLPELRALPAHDRRRQHGLRAEDRRRRPRTRSRKRVEEAAKILDLDRVPRAQAEGALRWSAPARRHGPRHRPQPAGLPHGRAAVEPRRQAARADPHPDRLAAAPPRRHHRLRHPRPGRGHDDGRPGRGAQGRPPPAGRHPAQAVRQARPTSSSPASSAPPR